GPGIFSDPNDFSLILVTGILVLAHYAIELREVSRRLLLLVSMAVLAYAFALTNSRGGFLSFVAGAVGMLVARWGWRRSVPLAVAFLPLMLVLFAGRQTDINIANENDTAQGRIQIWREGLSLFRQNPVFGIGWQMYEDHVGHVAHN